MAKATASAKPAKRRFDQYNDPSYNYLRYWDGRDYENLAEAIAIRRLLKGMHFGTAVDVGGGYGRLCLLLEEYADKVVLAEPSQQQLDLAKDYLKGHEEIERKLMQADDLQFKDGSVDLITIVRVLHHLPKPDGELAEVARVLSAEGIAIIEVANYSHIRNRIKHILRGKRLPTDPIDIRSQANRDKGEIPFVNHNPDTLVRQMERAGLQVERVLSVSNLRSPMLKKFVPLKIMTALESAMQRPLASMYFGPSVFFLVKKKAS